MRQEVPGWGNSPTYWGSSLFNYYLFRRTFTLPAATNFDGSTIDIGTPTGAGFSSDPHAYYTVYVNGTQVDSWQDRGLRRDVIST